MIFKTNCWHVTCKYKSFWSNSPPPPFFFWILKCLSTAETGPRPLLFCPTSLYLWFEHCCVSCYKKSSATTYNERDFKTVPFPLCPCEQLKVRLRFCALTLSRRDGGVFILLYIYIYIYICLNSPWFSLMRILLLHLNLLLFFFTSLSHIGPSLC